MCRRVLWVNGWEQRIGARVEIGIVFEWCVVAEFFNGRAGAGAEHGF